ncbi:MAG: hypothetical protein DF168_01862 [Candidatus Moanabacter tarae]|uniref:LPS-assembly lipoprotein LptE n=1 Tax=Candidatus Moanibacter tarae TaxID=2200854 RepID=A0A2Z4AGA4_9BACT|nr:MAG: hypothetical protein DF168_01862 [Candidatus Moanabacter tarae]|tara:strand:+ start:91401 stop:91904 length:504 start_codon:yes stop_codon:yes gene_type:complete
MGAVCFPILSVFFFLTGCSRYHLGNPNELPFQSLYIKQVENRSLLPQINVLLAQNLVDAFLRDGSVLITSEDKSDALLAVTIEEANRRRFATQSNDTLRGRSFALVLRATATLTDTRNGLTFFDAREFTVSEIIFTDEGLQPAEYQAISTLARDLARKIKDSIVSPW